MKNAGIYILTSPSGKQYIGKDSNLPSRVNRHLNGHEKGCKGIHNAVKKYGKDAFDVQIIRYPYISEQLLNIFERSHIAELGSFENGYNGTRGGEGLLGYVASKETRQKLSAAHTGKAISQETRQKFSAIHTGKKVSLKTRQKLSAAHTGKKHSKETRQKISASNKGRTHSKETRQKISETQKGKKVSLKTRQKLSAAYTGRTLSEEHRQKLSAIHKGKTFSKETRQKLSEVQRKPEYDAARRFFSSLPSDMPIREKRQHLYAKYPYLQKGSIRRWVRQWLA